MFMRVVNTGSTHGNCYVLKSNSGEILLLDCGCRYKDILKAIDYRTSDVSGVLLTHEHGDHRESFKNLMNLGIQIYTNDETVEHLQIITGELMKGVPEKRPFRVGSFTVIPFYLPHTTRDKDTGQLIQCFNYGYIVEHEEMGKLLYMTDFEFCRYNFKAMRLNHLVIECNYCKELVDKTAENYTHRLKGHCSLDTCKSLVNTNHTAALRTVTLVHLSNEAADPEQILKEIKEAVVWDDALVQIATPGLEVNLDLCPF